MIFWLVLIFFGFSPPSSAQESAARLLVPVFIGEQNLGEIWVRPQPEKMPMLEKSSLAPILSKALNAEGQSRLETLLHGNEVFPPAILKDIGISLVFNETSLVFEVRVEEAIRSRRIIPLRNQIAEKKETTGPANFSGYVNGSANQGFVYPQTKARLPFRGVLGSAANLRGLVLETGAVFTEKENYQWRREDTRLVKDFEEKMLRLSVGDIQISTSGYQSSRSLGGISLVRQYSIQPYLNTRPLNNTEIILRRPSTIEVYVNDGFISRIAAPSGPIQLSDFPLFSGINKVDLKITDDTGRIEWINLNLLYDVQLLGKGIHSFAYQIGAPSESFQADRRYDDNKLTFSFFHRFGWSDRVTVGGSYQADRGSFLVGQDFVFLTRLGLFSLETGISHLSGGPTAPAARFKYKSLDYKRGADKPLRGALELEYKNKAFTTLGQGLANNEYSWKLDMSLSRPLTTLSSIGVGGQYNFRRSKEPDLKSARAEYTNEFSPQWRVNLNYGIEKQNLLVHSFQIVFSWIESEGKYYGNASYSYPAKTMRMEASRSPSMVVDDYRLTLGAQNSPNASQGDVVFDYTHEKAILRMDHASARLREREGFRRTRHSTSVTLASGIAWAGGSLGWTRPIGDSFALIKTKPLYKKFRIPVNPNGESAEAHVNRFGPAVVPTLTSYGESPLSFDSSMLPMGYTLGKDFISARPTYRSGIHIDLGGESTVVVTGKLMAPDQKPLGLATGSVTQGGLVVKTFFTNREGNFLLENLAPGKYQILMDEKDYPPLDLLVSEKELGLWKLGVLQFSKGVN